MRFLHDDGLGRSAVVLLALALAVPLLNGCSQLGIAKTDDLTALENRLQATDTRVDTLEKNSAEMQKTLAEITTKLDTLNARFARAKTWLETMNIDTIASDAQKASQEALDAEARSRAFFEHYLEWIKGQQALLQEQIKTLEASMTDKEVDKTTIQKTPDAAPSEEKPKDSGGGGGG